MFSNPTTPEICDTLARIETIAVVGLSPQTNRPSYRIARAMQQFGFRIVPVRPLITDVLGEQAYAALSDLPFAVDLVNVFRAADAIDVIVDDCIKLGISRVWIQDGIINAPAAARAVSHGIWTVMDRCIWRDYTGLCGGMRASA